jgi:Flp pilus assembly protein TadG
MPQNSQAFGSAHLANTTSAIHRKQRGAVAILAAIFLPLLITIAALAIDISNLMLVKNELQNAADAAAQAGAQCLYRRTECGNLTNTVPDWNTAHTRATLAVPNNAVQGTALADSVVTSGYWNVTGTPGTLQLLPHTPTANDAPAVQVTIAKESGKNAGSVTLYLAGLMGLRDANLSATAISVVTSPGTEGPGGLFPFAITKCMYDAYWNSATSLPKNATTATLNGVPQTIGQPWKFRLGSDVQILPDGSTCDGGQWTSFKLDTNNVPNVRMLISEGNPTALAIGEKTWIQPGVQATIYSSANDCSAAGTKACEYATAPVTLKASVKGEEPILAFGCLHILLASQSKKYIEVQMSNICPNPEGGGAGPDYGVHNPPRLGL